MADGLAGHEHDFYHYVMDNPWLGGNTDYSPLNEAFPYWLNGLVPLAYALDDERLKTQVLGAVDYIVGHQQADGWLGPETDPRTRNFWARYPVLLAMTQLAEADRLPGLAAIGAFYRFLPLMHSMLQANYTGYVLHPGDNFDEQWGRARAADMVAALQWFYARDAPGVGGPFRPENASTLIWDCMQWFYDKAYDWSYWFNDGVYIKGDLDLEPVDLTNQLFPYLHGVNAGQGLKAGAVIRRFTANDSLITTTKNGIDWTLTYHGAPSGSIIGDERQSGLSPLRGTELCTVVETMYSLTYAYQALGDRDYADRAELAAFNALPAMLMPRWWAHQYVIETNQPISHKLDQTPFWNVNTVGQTFGLEPNYPCCTVNHPQGYPKFLSATFSRSGDSGLAHTLLAPAKVTTQLPNGVNLTVDCATNYPFNHVFYYTISSSGPFTFSVRVPGWAIFSGTTFQLNGAHTVPAMPDFVTGMANINIPAGNNVLVYRIGASIRVEPRANDTVAIYHGALLYALPVTGNYSFTSPANYPPGSGAPLEAHDWTILPNSPWNVAIDINTLYFYDHDNRDDEQLPNPIFEQNAPPVVISALVCEIGWNLTNGYAGNPPLPGQRNCTGPAFTVGLTPFGAAKLHMAELPTVDLSPSSRALRR
ncbi:MAG: hypothetical protein Q9227_002766 [Pyrenula ochraceoflavens]